MTTTEQKPTLSALQTPLSATLKTPISASLKTPLSPYPSELRSPMVPASTPTFIKKEDALKTPITPPNAYLDFLSKLSPVLMSPMPTGSSSKFVFEANRPTSTPSVTSSAASSASYTTTSMPVDKASPASEASSRASSCCNCDHGKQEKKDKHDKHDKHDKTDKPEPPMSAPPTKTDSQTVTIPPPSPFTRPQSARTPRLYIPQSPYSPASVLSPMSAHSVHSAHSAASPYSAVSPRTWDLDKRTGRTRRVSVREVVTRTVTYSSTPVDTKAPQIPQMDPAPRGKRRKIE